MQIVLNHREIVHFPKNNIIYVCYSINYIMQMTIKGIIKTIAAGLILATAMSCGSEKAVIDPDIMLAYGKEPNEQNMDALSKNYSTVIGKNRKNKEKDPGIYCDYAVMLVKQGKRAEANGYFNKEMEAFPSSRGYVMQLKRRLIPEYQDDNSTSAADADTVSTEQEALTPLQRKRAEERAATVLGDTTDVQTEAIEPDTTDIDEESVEEPAVEEQNANEQEEPADDKRAIGDDEKATQKKEDNE